MKQNQEVIKQLKGYLLLQLEAYHKEDWLAHDELEEKILELEKRL